MKITYKKTENGRIFKCTNCNDIHIEYKILNINLSERQFKQFSLNIIAIDGEAWEARNKCCEGKRKIFIPLESKSIILMLNNTELIEFKTLVEQVVKKTALISK